MEGFHTKWARDHEARRNENEMSRDVRLWLDDVEVLLDAAKRERRRLRKVVDGYRARSEQGLKVQRGTWDRAAAKLIKIEAAIERLDAAEGELVRKLVAKINA